MIGSSQQTIAKGTFKCTGFRTFQQVNPAGSLSNKTTLSFISYNVWFDQHNFDQRHAELMKMFKQLSPDFICLQEVTQRFIDLMSQDSDICNAYYFSDTYINSYNVMILSKYSCCEFKSRLFQSNMGRNLVYGVITINNRKIAIGTTHLESMPDNINYRQQQLFAIQDELKIFDESFFMGDMNCDYQKEEEFISSQYQDTWKMLKQNIQGNTYPSGNYLSKGIRYDKIYMKQSQTWKPKQIDIIGNYSIPLYQQKQPGRNEITAPSDHCGLYVEFKLA